MALTNAQDLTIRRGDNAPRIIWRLPIDITGSVFVLTMRLAGGLTLTRRSDEGGLLVDAERKLILWPYTALESALIPRGRISTYELARKLPGGESRVYAAGTITGIGGPPA